MALVNPGLSPIILGPSAGKDSRWLTLEVCREFARSKCSRTEDECKYAHPPTHVEIQNGRVTCCFDSIKGKCQRKDPPCKYLHPPQHLKEILLQNGRQNLMIKNFQMHSAIQPVAVQMPTVYPVVYEPVKSTIQAPTPSYSSMIMPGGQYLTLMPPGSATHPYLMPSPMGYAYYNPQTVGSYSAIVPTYDAGAAAACTIPVTMETSQMMGSNMQTIANGLTQQLFVAPSSLAKQLESSSGSRGSPSSVNHQGSQPVLPWECSLSPSTSIFAVDSTNTPYCQPLYYKRQVVEVMAAMGRKRPHEISSASTSSDDLILGMNAVPGMLPLLKRPALVDAKSGLPVYQQVATPAAYPHAATFSAMQFQKHQFVPITIAGTTSVIPRIN